MELLTPFDFVDMFDAAGKLAVIGNAPSLAKSGMGRCIDSYDIVVRFNDCRVRGFEADVGSRTDILVCNPYAETRPDSILNEIIDPAVVLVLTPQTRRGERSEFERWAGKNKVLFSYTPDIRLDTVPRQNIALTTGTYGVSLLYNLLRPQQLLVTGFTMFSPGTDFHYWSNKTPNGTKSHSFQNEAKIFVDILNSLKCRIDVTEDILDISTRCATPFGQQIRFQQDNP